MMIISIVAALGKNNVIGSDNKLPWKLPADMKRFVALTTGKPVIMGRRTFESIGKPLKNRLNIVLTQSNFRADGCIVAHSVDEALKAAKNEKEVMVIGGAVIYEQFIPHTNRMYLTLIDYEFEGDRYFPDFNRDEWTEVEKEEHSADENNPYDYTFVTLEKI